MMNKAQKAVIETGYGILFHGETFIPRTIQNTMEKHGKDENLSCPLLGKWIGNHAGVLIWIEGQLYVFEAIANGYKPTRLIDDYDLLTLDYVIFKVKDFTDEEKNAMVHWGLKMVKVNTFYNYPELLLWLIRVYLKINLFGKGTIVRQVCYGALYRFYNHFDPVLYPPIGNGVSFYDLIKPSAKLVIDGRKDS